MTSPQPHPLLKFADALFTKVSKDLFVYFYTPVTWFYNNPIIKPIYFLCDSLKKSLYLRRIMVLPVGHEVYLSFKVFVPKLS